MKTKKSVPFVLVLTLALNMHSSARADSQRDGRIAAQLKAFDQDSATFMNELPPKERDGISLSTSESIFPENASSDRGFARSKAEFRRAFMAKRAFSPHAAVGSNDHFEDLVDKVVVRTLPAIETLKLTSARLPSSPWSGSYWPLYLGSLADRYADPSFPGGMDWKKNADYVRSTEQSTSIETMSPAEKYDFLVGDASHALTHASLAAGEAYYGESRQVATWMGICHGWSPAAYMEKRPSNTVTVVAQDGRTKIPFNPTDIKGLASLLWANGKFADRFIGSRCDVENPKKDSFGRIIDPACFDENPATWHLAVVNQIGADQRSFVMDANFDYQVWNQPVYSYSYTYFNPQTLKPASSLGEATVERGQFTHDKFARYRSKKAVSFVGIAMDLTYVSETGTSQSPTDSPSNDSHITVSYLYDLELDANGALVGGEWYRNAHPDFLWTPTPTGTAVAEGDALVSARPSWDGSVPVPSEWFAGIAASSRQNQPLAHVVAPLILLSQLGME